VFNVTTPFRRVCRAADTDPAGEVLRRAYFVDDVAGGAAEVESPASLLTYGEWIRLAVASGFVIEGLTELRPDPAHRQSDTTFTEYAEWSWARRFPAEHVWQLRRGGAR
jgi:hypothetical protein